MILIEDFCCFFFVVNGFLRYVYLDENDVMLESDVFVDDNVFDDGDFDMQQSFFLQYED